GGGQVLGHGQDQHVRRGGGQVRVQHALFPQHVEEPGQADGDARAGELPVRVVLRQVVIPAAGADRADLRAVQAGGLVDGAGVVGPGQADGDARAGELPVRVVLRQVVIPAAGADRADLRVVQEGGLVDGAGVVVQAPGDGEVHGKVFRRDAEVRQVPDHGVQLL